MCFCTAVYLEPLTGLSGCFLHVVGFYGYIVSITQWKWVYERKKITYVMDFLKWLVSVCVGNTALPDNCKKLARKRNIAVYQHVDTINEEKNCKKKRPEFALSSILGHMASLTSH